MIKAYTALGLMSGTSGDGVDASIIQSNGKNNYKVIVNKYYKYSEDIFNSIHDIKEKINNTKDLAILANELQLIEKKITLFHIEVAKDLLNKNSVDLIGFHGQTILHLPKEIISKQIGDGNLLSQLLNCSVYGYTKQSQKRYICHKHNNICYNDLSDNSSDEWSD